MKIDREKWAKEVGALTDKLPPGMTLVAIVFDEQGNAMCLSRKPFTTALGLVSAWIVDRYEELNDAIQTYTA
jgi:hypothetical protein